MNSFIVLLKKDLTGIFRTKKFLIMLMVLISFAILSPISAKLVGVLLKVLGDNFGGELQGVSQLMSLLGGASYTDSYAQFAGNLAELFIFILIIIFGASIIKEKVNGTYYILKMNGVSDRKFILSHIASQIITFTISYVISCIVFLVSTYILFSSVFAKNWLYSLLSLYLLIVFFIILMNFISCYSKSTTMSMIANFSTYFGIVILDIFPKIRYFLPFSLNNNTISVLDGKINLDNNISIISTLVWCIMMLVIMMIFKKNSVKNG